MQPVIDVTFDFRTDTPPRKDPDGWSPHLRAYHQLLWSKPLPGGVTFHLRTDRSKIYLEHRSELGEFRLSSDTVIPSYWKYREVAGFIGLIEQYEIEEFRRIVYTMGGMMLFPSNRVGGRSTINGARGFHRQIRDRFDLTMECIRRYYASEPSPLHDTLARYDSFFSLFGSFAGFVDFFLLQDIVSADYSSVRFSLPFDDFERSPIPDCVETYTAYKTRAIAFVQARNRRISAASGAAPT